MTGLFQTLKAYLPGMVLCALIALASQFVSSHYGGPLLLYALLLGLVIHFLYKKRGVARGVDFCAKHVLRIGVALLGFRITFDQVAALGWQMAGVVFLGVISTIGLGCLLARAYKRPITEGLISGSAVGICGASAALTVSSVLPPTKENERFTLLAVVGVTVLSTLAMVVYPLLAKALALSNTQAGFFFGATIHDVAQVVAAGALLSTPTDSSALDTATIVKLFRVMLLMPVALVIASLFRSATTASVTANNTEEAAPAVPLLPGFLLAFVVFMLLGTVNALPPGTPELASTASRICLVLAIAAVGVKTRFESLLNLGWLPVWMLVLETLWIAVFAGGAVLLLAA